MKNDGCFTTQSILSTNNKVQSGEKKPNSEGSDKLLVFLYILSSTRIFTKAIMWRMWWRFELLVSPDSTSVILTCEKLYLCRRGPGLSYSSWLEFILMRKSTKAISVASSLCVLHTLNICRYFILQRHSTCTITVPKAWTVLQSSVIPKHWYRWETLQTQMSSLASAVNFT